MKMVYHNKRITSKKLYYILYETTIYYYVLYYSIRYTLLKSCCPKFCQKLRLSTMKAAAVVLCSTRLYAVYVISFPR